MWTFVKNGLERKVTMAEESTNMTTADQNVTEATETPTTNTTSNNVENANQEAQTDSQKESAQLDIEKLIQKAVDRATNKLGNENKKLRGQLDTLKKEKLTDDEIKKLELADKEADIADREAKLAEKENRLFAIKAIKDAGLDDGSSNALELVDFVMTDSEESTTARVKAFSELVKKFVTAQVNQTFKSNGRNPEKGGSTSSEENSHAKNIAVNIGKTVADRNATANNVLKHYLGGK